MPIQSPSACFKQRWQTFVASRLLNVRICCLSLPCKKVNEGAFGFGLLVGQKTESSHESIMRITVSCSPTTEGVTTSPLSLPQTCSSCLVHVVEAHTRTHSGVMARSALVFLSAPSMHSWMSPPHTHTHTHTHWQAKRQIHSSKRSHASISLTAAEHSSEQGGEFLLSSPGIIFFRLPPKDSS